MKTAPKISSENGLDDADGSSALRHTGEQPFRRPPEDEPERVGEGELDIGAPVNDVSVRERVWEGEEDGEDVSPDEEND